jgi:hypothetical protein
MGLGLAGTHKFSRVIMLFNTQELVIYHPHGMAHDVLVHLVKCAEGPRTALYPDQTTIYTRQKFNKLVLYSILRGILYIFLLFPCDS